MKQAFDSFFSVLSNKQKDSFGRALYLGIFAGAYIGIGGTLFSIVTSFSGDPNILRAIGAFLFCIGLILIVFLKAQLFTGNNLMIAPLLIKKAKLPSVLRNWFSVYIGNLIGSLIIVTIMYFLFGRNQSISGHIQKIAIAKTQLPFLTAFGKAILCNTLVCIAVWFAIIGMTVPKKIIGIIIPISLFVYLGFEHSIANMFFIPLGLSFSGQPIAQNVNAFWGNLIPVTLGNIVGGLLVSTILMILYRNNND